jgi:hypothetical protein
LTSHYKQVLAEARDKTDKLASEYITELYLILRDEEQRPPEDCRAIIERDCSDMWSEDTIRKYLPPETKNATRRKAGTISAEVKKKKKAKLLAATTANSGQYSAVLDSDDNNYGHDSVEMNPTENGSVEQKEPESRTFQEITDSRHSGNVWTEDYFLSRIEDRHKDEKRELEEDLAMDEHVSECVSKSLLLPSELAKQIYSDVNESRTSGIIPDFELEHDGIRIVSITKCSDNGNRNFSDTDLYP